MRLIDADEVTNKILYLLQGGVPSQDIRRGIKKIYTMLCDAPTIEAEPLKHGRWLLNGMILNRQKCSVCGFYSDDLQADNYCPNCGAQMISNEQEEKR